MTDTVAVAIVFCVVCLATGHFIAAGIIGVLIFLEVGNE